MEKLRQNPPRHRLDRVLQWLASLYAAPVWERLAIGVAAAACGALWRYSVMDILGSRVSYLTFYPVVTVAGLLGGVASGASAAVAAATLAHLWFVPLADLGDWLGLVTFLASSGIIAGIAEMFHRTWKRAARAETERARAERQFLIRDERMNAISGMAMALAHELNQPLAATVIYLNAAKRLLRAPDEQSLTRVDYALGQAAEQVLRAGQIISHMRQFVGRGEPDKTFCNCHELIRNASSFIRESAEGANVTIELKLDATNDRVLGDSVQITQVLVNIMKNACEAMSALPKRALTVSTWNEQDLICVAVADIGPGLAKSIQDKLFEPFVTTKRSGMGVGLSISRAIIEAHYGRIWVDSKPEGGTVIRFSLPLAE